MRCKKLIERHNTIFEYLTRAEMRDAKANLSKKEKLDKASRLWDEAISLSKSGKTGEANNNFHDAYGLYPNKEFKEWKNASDLALQGKSDKLNKLLGEL